MVGSWRIRRWAAILVLPLDHPAGILRRNRTGGVEPGNVLGAELHAVERGARARLGVARGEAGDHAQTREPFERLEAGEFQVGFFMNSTGLEQVKEVALAGERMPQKATFFYPKLPTGLVFQDLSTIL